MSTLQAQAHDGAALIAIIEQYNVVTERLKRSHDALRREVVRLRDELHEKNKELQRRERLAALGEMAAGLAHEIRNPLGGIRLYASLMERDLVDRPQALELVRKLDMGVRSLDAIVSDVLAFAGGPDASPAAVSLGDVLTSALTQCQPHADAKAVTIDLEHSDSGMELFCDANQVERAILNLLLNAIEAVDHAGRVWISADFARSSLSTEGDSFVEISVMDDGPGIPPDLLQKVFHPFFTTKHTGTGLGLAIVHRIAEANGGRIRAGHRSGGGAVFTLALPSAMSGMREGEKQTFQGDEVIGMLESSTRR